MTDPRPRMSPRLRPIPPPGRWKHGSIPVLGLIGGIGSGKSQVASVLAGLGARVIDADAVGHMLLNRRPVRDRLVARFGPGILAADDPAVVDRRALGAIVFADPSARRDLEAIVHPRMRRSFAKTIARAVAERRARAVVLDAAVLFEAGWNTLCDRVLFVDTPRPERLARLAAQRGWTEATLSAREGAQWALDEKQRRADAVLHNADDLRQLETEVGRFWDSLGTAGEFEPCSCVSPVPIDSLT
jgi:dephospho-CoA kinase